MYDPYSDISKNATRTNSTISVQTPRTTTAFAQRPLCAPAELLLRWRRSYCAAMATLRRPHCTLIRTANHGVCFEHTQSARRRSAYYVVPQRLLAMPLRCCRDACNRTARTSAFCIFLRGISVGTLLWCDKVLGKRQGLQLLRLDRN